MCRTYYGCDGCLARNNDGSCKFSTTVGDGADEQIALLEEWSAAHPRKTRQSVFLEQWPEARIYANGALSICPNAVCAWRCGKDGERVEETGTCDDCCREFWTQEVE
mgnify:CR=1 FL=1